MHYQADNSNAPREGVVDCLALLRAHARLLKADRMAADDLVELTLKRAIADVHHRPANGTLFEWMYGIMLTIEGGERDPSAADMV